MSARPKALTVWQPYASLLAAGLKRCETRGWSTHYRGPLIVHAAKSVSGMSALLHCPALLRRMQELLRDFDARNGTDLATYPMGAPLGVVDLVHVSPVETVAAHAHTSPDELAFGDYTPGRFAWHMVRPRVLRRRPSWPGAQGLWTVPAAWTIPSAESFVASTAGACSRDEGCSIAEPHHAQRSEVKT